MGTIEQKPRKVRIPRRPSMLYEFEAECAALAPREGKEEAPGLIPYDGKDEPFFEVAPPDPMKF